MALTERTENDKIEVVGPYKHIQVRKATIIEKDGVELTRSFERYVLNIGGIDSVDNLVDTDLSNEDVDVQAICNAAWTDAVKESWRLKLISDRDSVPQ